jgi:hypothetical protein
MSRLPALYSEKASKALELGTESRQAVGPVVDLVLIINL